jgi:hypothetical protein
MPIYFAAPAREESIGGYHIKNNDFSHILLSAVIGPP